MKLVGIVLVNLFFVHGILGMEQEEQTPSRETRIFNVEVGNASMYWVQKKSGSFSGTVARELANKKKELQDSKKNTEAQKDT